MATGEAGEELQLRWAGQLVEQLGAQLYPSVTASVAELISNAWDADAQNVWVTVPFDADWRRDAVIEVLDDGHGMTREQAQANYLVVGLNRRKDRGATSEGGRSLHGRKGIGKLAAFGTAGHLECVTLRDGKQTAFGIDYERLRRHPPTQPYTTEPVDEAGALVNPDTEQPLAHGTRVRLSKLKAKRRPSEAVFRRSMARRFVLDAAKMTVKINGEPLGRFEYSLHVRFPRDGVPKGFDIEIGDDGWATERIDISKVREIRAQRALERAREDELERGKQAPQTGSQTQSAGESGPLVSATPNPEPEDEALGVVRWWIGFAAQPIAEEDVRGVSILARGKLAQAPFTFEMSQGTTNQLGLEYLVGEVRADWLDYGQDADDDLIQSNRDQLQLDNEELQPLLDWGRERLRWALGQWGRVRRDNRAGPSALGGPVEKVLQAAPARSRNRLRTLAARIADVTQADSTDVARAVEAVVAATDAAAVRTAAEELELESDPDDDQTWKLLEDAALATRDSAVALLETRAAAIDTFILALREPPVTTLHERVATDAWLISPLLADVPRQVIRDRPDVTVVTFNELLPILPATTFVCWAPDAEPISISLPPTTKTIWIGSRRGETDQAVLSWEELLTASASAHRALVSTITSG